MREQLKFNLIKKYKAYDLPVGIYKDAVNYAEEHAKKDGLTLIESASCFIENSVLMQAEEKGQYRRMIDAYYVSEASKYSSFFAVPYKSLIEEKDKMVDDIISKGSNDYKTSLGTIIRKKIDKKYKAQKQEQSTLFGDGFRKNNSDKKKKNEIVFDENMKFLRKYYSLSELNKITKIPTSTLFDTLVSGRKMNDDIKEKILSSFCVTSSEMLFAFLKDGKIENLLKKHQKNIEKENSKLEKFRVETKKEEEEQKNTEKIKQEKVTNHVNDSKTYNISFLKEYFEKTKYSKKAFARHLRVDVSKVDEWLDGALFKGKYLGRLLVFFEEEELSKLISRVRRELNDILIEELKIQEENKKKQKIYDISFFEKYIETKHISKTSLSNILDMSIATINKMLSGERLLKEEELNLLLKYFEVSNFDELKTKILEESNIDLSNKKSKVQDKIYNISFFEKYIETKHISKTNLSDILDMSIATINKMLSGERLLKEEELNLLLKYFEVSNFDELKTKISEESKEDLRKKYTKVQQKIHDISFIDNYVKSKNITKTLLMNVLNVSGTTINKMLSGERLLKEEELKLLFDYFKADNYESLKEKISSIKPKKEEIKRFEPEEIKYNISFLNDYIKDKNIPINEISRYLGYSAISIKKCLENEYELSEKHLKKLLEFFKVSAFRELKEIVDKYNEMSDEEKMLDDRHRSSYDLSRYSDYIKRTIGFKKIQEELFVSYATVVNWFSSKGLIKKEYVLTIFNLLGVKNLKELDAKSKEEIIVPKKEKTDYTFLKEFLIIKGISQCKLAKTIGVNENNVYKWVNNINNPSDENIKKILEYLGYSSFEEIKEEVEKYKKEKNIDGDMNKREDLGLTCVDEYLKINGIPYLKLSKELKIDYMSLTNCLHNKRKISNIRLNQILEYLGFDSLDEIKKIVEEHKKENNGQIVKKSKEGVDAKSIQYINDYLYIKDISYAKLSEMIGRAPSLLSRWLNGKIVLSEKNLNMIIKSLGFNNIKELVNVVEQNKKENNGKLVKEDLFLVQRKNMIYIKEYLIIKNISNEKLSKMLELNRTTISKWLNNKVLVSDKKIEKLINTLGLNTIDELKDFVDTYKENHDGKLITEELTEMSYIKEYISMKELSIKEVAVAIHVNQVYLSKWLNNTCGVNEFYIEKLLNHLGFRTIDEVKCVVEEYKKEHECDSIGGYLFEEQKENFKYIRDYMILKGIIYDDICKALDLCVTSVANWFNDRTRITKENYTKLLEYLGFNDIEELKQVVNDYKTKHDCDNIKDNLRSNQVEKNKYLKEYVIIKGITYGEIAKGIGMTRGALVNWMSKTAPLSTNKLVKMIEFLGFSDFEDLKQFVEKFKEENDGKLLPNDEDLKYVNEYLKIKKIYKKTLGREIGVPESTILSWLDTKYQISNENLMKILNHLGFNHINELKEYVDAYYSNETLEENEKDDIIIEKIGDDDNMQNEDIEGRKIIVNTNVLYELLKGYQVDETEYKVIGLLFGGLKDKCYSVEEVSQIIDIDIKEVLKIYQVCLKIYFDAFNRKCDETIKYSLQNY